MKQLLIIRAPFERSPEQDEILFKHAVEKLEAEYHVVLCKDSGVERVEFEIVYNPYFKPYSFEFNGEKISGEELKVRLKDFLFEDKDSRQFEQVNTSTNAYMEQKDK